MARRSILQDIVVYFSVFSLAIWIQGCAPVDAPTPVTQVQVVTVTVSTGDLELPIFYTNSTLINGFFDADRAVVESKLVDTPFKLAAWNGNTTSVGIGFYEYLASSIGPYIEVGVVIPVVRKTDPIPTVSLIADLLRPPHLREIGFYVLHIPADNPVAVAAGIEIWGFTKFNSTFDFSLTGDASSRSMDITVNDPNTVDTIMTISGTVTSGINIGGSSSLTYSDINDVAQRNTNELIGSPNVYLYSPGSLVLSIGDSQHPMAQDLRDMGLDGASPTTLTIATEFQSGLYFGEVW